MYRPFTLLLALPLLTCSFAFNSNAQKVKPKRFEDWEVFAVGINVRPVKKSDGSYDRNKVTIGGRYNIENARGTIEPSVERFYVAAVYGEKKEEGKMAYFGSLAAVMLSPVNSLPTTIKFSRKVEVSKASVWLMANRSGAPLKNIKDGQLHHFSAKFTSHPQLLKDKIFIQKQQIDTDFWVFISADMVVSFVFETPIPEFSADVRAKYGTSPKFRYKVTYEDKKGKKHTVKIFDVEENRRGMRSFRHTWKTEDNGHKVKYTINLEYQKGAEWKTVEEEKGVSYLEVTMELKYKGAPAPF